MFLYPVENTEKKYNHEMLSARSALSFVSHFPSDSLSVWENGCNERTSQSPAYCD